MRKSEKSLIWAQASKKKPYTAKFNQFWMLPVKSVCVFTSLGVRVSKNLNVFDLRTRKTVKTHVFLNTVRFLRESVHFFRYGMQVITRKAASDFHRFFNSFVWSSSTCKQTRGRQQANFPDVSKAEWFSSSCKQTRKRQQSIFIGLSSFCMVFINMQANTQDTACDVHHFLI